MNGIEPYLVVSYEPIIFLAMKSHQPVASVLNVVICVNSSPLVRKSKTEGRIMIIDANPANSEVIA